MKFGNWIVTDKTLEYSGAGTNRFVIDNQTLMETETIGELNDKLYKWILLASQEDWLAEDDLYDLNFAFVYAAARQGSEFDYEVFDTTLDYQFEMLDMEEDDDISSAN